jgi:hypothetical protein
MENKQFYKKAIVGAIFILAAAIVTYIGYNEVYAQSITNQTAVNPAGPTVPYTPGPSSNPQLYPPFNQSKIFPNNTETAKSFNKLNGNNTQFFTKDKSISNMNNSIGSSLSTNSFQSH